MPDNLTNMWSLKPLPKKQSTKHTDTENRWVVATGVGNKAKVGEDGQNVQISCYKLNKSSGYNV